MTEDSLGRPLRSPTQILHRFDVVSFSPSLNILSEPSRGSNYFSGKELGSEISDVSRKAIPSNRVHSKTGNFAPMELSEEFPERARECCWLSAILWPKVGAGILKFRFQIPSDVMHQGSFMNAS